MPDREYETLMIEINVLADLLDNKYITEDALTELLAHDAKKSIMKALARRRADRNG